MCDMRFDYKENIVYSLGNVHEVCEVHYFKVFSSLTVNSTVISAKLSEILKNTVHIQQLVSISIKLKNSKCFRDNN